MERGITGREAQLAELAAVAGLHDQRGGQPPEPAPPLVVVFGGVSTGKSLCVNHLLSSSADHFALVDCTGVMATREFYREILGQLHRNSRRRRRVVVDVGEDGEDQLQDECDDTDEVTITDAPQILAGVRPMNGKRRKRSNKDNTDSEPQSDSDEDGQQGPVLFSNKSQRPLKAGAQVGGDDGADEVAAEALQGSLNFLSFLKALRHFMDGELGPESKLHVPTMYVALDHVETLLDRGFDKLLTCLLTVNDQLDYLHVFDADGPPWRLCVLLTTRAVSLNLDLFLQGAHPAFIHFPAYTKDEVASIVAHNVLRLADSESPSFLTLHESRERSSWLRRWLVSVYDLLPHCHNDWLEFQHIVAQMLPSFYAFFDVVSDGEHAQLPQLASAATGSSEANGKNSSWKQLQFKANECVSLLEKTRRRHLFGYDCVATNPVAIDVSTVSPTRGVLAPVTSGDPVAFIASSKLSRSCLLLLVACYLASFTPHEADAHFVSSSGGTKRKRRTFRVSGESGGSNGTPSDNAGNGKKNASTAATRKAMNQQLIGPKIFELPRLLAIYASLLVESDAAMAEEDDVVVWKPGSFSPDERSTRTRADVFTHLSLLVRLRLLQRASPPSDLDQPLFRCIADTRLVEEIAHRLQFPLHSYLTTRA